MSMFRIVDGFVYEGKVSKDRFHVTLRDLGHGHREASVSRCIDWVEDGPLSSDPEQAQRVVDAIDKLSEEERRAANIRRAARRAKSAIRQKCKVQGLDTLLTLT